ncbi:hypothetical protein TVAG_195010 [Trichomonas vaginalis G3]|uniref:Uncharacterized protein n=1 Tax=Trichomonas vaginalis (strain ATCC PRA-98 / G3) TaxID=412133 RepID=A2FZL2_TRIV3|nr:hypothetical protein TVAGG3_0836670 [Trichomonas vaginalis G3]EAX89647.1 hypothetical protein TVAG_195010 [Trichomonas vaginalis G3]KAI5498979.1 hypothetical protein TVAGG3_0836670 [Trichomonas vaginalis G3]|eukprot:XP_001302577.1 hypothetical protein [Trichomonas vaginalis G3]
MYHLSTSNSNVTYSMFLENYAFVSTEWGLLLTEANDLTVNQCVFLRNTASFTFATYKGGTMTVIHCSGDTLTNSGSVDAALMSTESFEIKYQVNSQGKCGFGFTYNSSTKKIEETEEYEPRKKSNLSFVCYLASIY